MSTLPREVVDEALAAGKARQEEILGVRYLRFRDDWHHVPRGTVVVEGRVVWGYPRIGRILRLETGLAEQFDGPFQAEEKIDGYNVRIVRLGGRVLAFTRGGFLCPFTTDRLPDLMDTGFLEAEPERVVCAEVAGPENPYLVGHPPFIGEDVRLFVFDLMRLDRPDFEPPDRRARLVREAGLPAAPVFGRYTAADRERLRALLRRLDAEGREGIVLKALAPPWRRAKYVTASSAVADVRVSVAALRQLPPEYFTNRILRLVLFLDEEGMDADPQLERALGAAFIEGLRTAIAQFRAEHRVAHRFRCRFHERAHAEALLALQRRLAGHGRVRALRLEREGAWEVLEFEKLDAEMTGLLGHVLRGGLVYD